MIRWLIFRFTPSLRANSSTVLIASAGPPIGVRGVDLVVAVPGNRNDRVTRDRQPSRCAAADPPEHDRVRPAAGVVRVRTGLLGSLRPLVGAEDQHRVGRGQHVPARRQRRLRRVRHLAALDLGADDEQQQRQQQPGHDRGREIQKRALPGQTAAVPPAPTGAAVAIGARPVGRETEVLLAAQARFQSPRGPDL